MVVNLPHFDLPFTFDYNSHAKVVEEGEIEDIKNCVEAAVRTTRNTRRYVPNFGITDPTFSLSPINLANIEKEIHDSESRALLNITQFIPNLDILADYIVVGVSRG